MEFQFKRNETRSSSDCRIKPVEEKKSIGRRLLAQWSRREGAGFGTGALVLAAAVAVAAGGALVDDVATGCGVAGSSVVVVVVGRAVSILVVVATVAVVVVVRVGVLGVHIIVCAVRLGVVVVARVVVGVGHGDKTSGVRLVVYVCEKKTKIGARVRDA